MTIRLTWFQVRTNRRWAFPRFLFLVVKVWHHRNIVVVIEWVTFLLIVWTMTSLSAQFWFFFNSGGDIFITLDETYCSLVTQDSLTSPVYFEQAFRHRNFCCSLAYVYCTVIETAVFWKWWRSLLFKFNLHRIEVCCIWQKSFFGVFHLKVRSVQNKFHEREFFLVDSHEKCNVISINEHWLRIDKSYC